LNETALFSPGGNSGDAHLAPPSAPFYRGSTGAAPGVLGSGFNFASNSFINVPAASAFNLNTPFSRSFVLNATANNNNARTYFVTRAYLKIAGRSRSAINVG
jgi:hypothetical protein